MFGIDDIHGDPLSFLPIYTFMLYSFSWQSANFGNDLTVHFFFGFTTTHNNNEREKQQQKQALLYKLSFCDIILTVFSRKNVQQQQQNNAGQVGEICLSLGSIYFLYIAP